MRVTTDPLLEGCPFIRAAYGSVWLFIRTKQRRTGAELTATGECRVMRNEARYLLLSADPDTIKIAGALK